MIEKTKFDFPIIKESTITFNEKIIYVDSFIGLGDEITLYSNYLETYFDESEDLVSRYMNAKYSFILGIVDLCTNIDIKNENKEGVDEGIDTDGLIGNGLWDDIVSKITNYKEVKDGIDKLVKNMEDRIALEKSIGGVIDSAVSKFMSFISEIDLSSENIEKLTKELREFGQDGMDKKLSNIFENQEEK